VFLAGRVRFQTCKFFRPGFARVDAAFEALVQPGQIATGRVRTNQDRNSPE
jgi:hypothetical protein